MSIDAIEALWIAVNLSALVLTAFALIDAWRSQQIVKVSAGEAARIVAMGNTRREISRLVIQGLLLVLILPGLFSDRITPINPFVLVLISVPILLLVSTILDSYDRHRLLGITWSEIDSERKLGLESLSRLTEAIQENTELTREGGKQALAAYHEANSVNQKISNLQLENLETKEREKE